MTVSSSVGLRRGYAAAGALLVGVYFVLGGRTQQVAYEAIGLVGVAAVFFGGRANFRNGSRRAWDLFAAGLLLEVAGDGVYTVYDFLGRTVPVPSIADALYLAGYPIIAGGVVVLLRDLGGRLGRAAGIDALIAFAAVATAQWVLVIGQHVHQHGSIGTRLVEIAYPCVDVLLFGALAQLIVIRTPRSVVSTPRRRGRPLGLRGRGLPPAPGQLHGG